MLRINYDGMNINVKFTYRIIGTELDGTRRCTWVKVIFPEQNAEFNGAATCHPQDNFSKSIGRKLALTNAMLDFDRDLRKIIWQEYHKHCK